MHQPVMIGPGTDPVEPAFEQLELKPAELLHYPLKHQNGENLLLEHVVAKELIGNLQKILLAMLRQDGPPKSHRDFAQLVGVPTPRLHFLLEEPLHLGRMRRRAAVTNHGANVLRNIGRALHTSVSAGKKVATFSLAGAGVSRLTATSAMTETTMAGKMASRSAQLAGRNGLP